MKRSLLLFLTALSVSCLGCKASERSTAGSGVRVAAVPPVVEQPAPPSPRKALPPAAKHTHAQGQLGPGAGALFIDLKAPPGAKLTLDAPVRVYGSGGIGLSFPKKLGGALGKHELPLRLPLVVQDGATGPATVDLSYYWCTEGNDAACRQEKAHLYVQLDLTGTSEGGEALFTYHPES